MVDHTPGPWIYRRHHKEQSEGHIYMEKAEGPCTIGLSAPVAADQEWLDEQGRLIAAAPDLLEAVKDLDDLIKDIRAQLDPDSAGQIAADELFALLMSGDVDGRIFEARKAIAKAEERTD